MSSVEKLPSNSLQRKVVLGNFYLTQYPFFSWSGRTVHFPIFFSNPAACWGIYQSELAHCRAGWNICARAVTSYCLSSALPFPRGNQAGFGFSRCPCVWNAAAASLEGTLEPAREPHPRRLCTEILQTSFASRAAERGNLELDYPDPRQDCLCHGLISCLCSIWNIATIAVFQMWINELIFLAPFTPSTALILNINPFGIYFFSGSCCLWKK